MNEELVAARRRWAAAAGGAIIVMALVFLFLRITRVSPASPLRQGPATGIAPRPAVAIEQAGVNDRILNDEKVMRDQMPLFLPTERNVTFRGPLRPEAGRTMLDVDDKRYSFGEAELKLHLPSAHVVPEKPVDLVSADPAVAPLYGFGAANSDVPRFPARGGLVEILDAETNRRVLAEALAVEAKPPTERPWRPLEFKARVDAAGLVGPLVISQRSDVEEVDRFFRNYLVQTFRIGERLPPGFYRILVGP